MVRQIVARVVKVRRGTDDGGSASAHCIGAYDEGNPTATISITNAHPTKILGKQVRVGEIFHEPKKCVSDSPGTSSSVDGRKLKSLLRRCIIQRVSDVKGAKGLGSRRMRASRLRSSRVYRHRSRRVCKAKRATLLHKVAL